MPLGRWLGSKAKLHGSTQSLNALEELQQLESAMRAVSHILNDDVDTAERLLGDGASPFHKLGRGVVAFMRATLGFEQEVMKEAADTLKDAETSASDHQRRAQRSPSHSSSIYPPGTEFAICVAQAQLMGAIVGVLNESLAESIKGFYNMRKAFVALDAIMDAEKARLGDRAGDSVSGSSQVSLASQPEKSAGALQGSGGLAACIGKMAIAREDDGPDSDALSDTDEFFDADEQHEGRPTPPVYAGHITIGSEKPEHCRPDGVSRALALDLDVQSILLATDYRFTSPSMLQDDPTDIFIHSAANMCFGVLMLVISMIPPVFATLLRIVGFKGDRDRGLAMLWQATRFDNIYGGLAGLVILSYYSGLLSFCDIVPGQGQEGAYPRERCAMLLADMRQRYPTSQLWLLEESRMLASARRLDDALDLMATATTTASSVPPSHPRLKQVEALLCFEQALDLLYAHRVDASAAAFETCIGLNNWSHGLYYYVAACAHVERHRDALSRHDCAAAARSKAEAERLLQLVPAHTGKKRFMARQLPFDSFVNRKLAKWEARRRHLCLLEPDASLVDAVGVAPAQEVVYFWNGHRRMQLHHLELSLKSIELCDSRHRQQYPGQEHIQDEPLDEGCIRSLLRATVLRNLGRLDEAKDVLQADVLSVDPALLRGGNRDNWTLPAGCYEMAVCLWEEVRRVEEDVGGLGDGGSERLRECGMLIDKVAKWGETYDLDARIGMRVTTAKDTLKRKGVETVT